MRKKEKTFINQWMQPRPCKGRSETPWQDFLFLEACDSLPRMLHCMCLKDAHKQTLPPGEETLELSKSNFLLHLSQPTLLWPILLRQQSLKTGCCHFLKEVTCCEGASGTTWRGATESSRLEKQSKAFWESASKAISQMHTIESNRPSSQRKWPQTVPHESENYQQSRANTEDLD